MNSVRVLIAAGLSAAKVFDLAVERGVVVVLDARGDSESDVTLARLLDKYYVRVNGDCLALVLAKLFAAWRGCEAALLALVDEEAVERVAGAVRRISADVEVASAKECVAGR